MKITTVGIDLAKNVFQVHGIDERGKAVLRKQLRRAQVAVFFANLPGADTGAWLRPFDKIREAVAVASSAAAKNLRRRAPSAGAGGCARSGCSMAWAAAAIWEPLRAAAEAADRHQT